MERSASRTIHTLAAAAYALLLGALAARAEAQELTGVVRDSATHRPIAGAVITLRDASGATVTTQLTSERGEFQLASIASGRALRIVRIGFEPRTVEIPVGIEPGSRMDIPLLALPSMLRPIRVLANSHCPVRSDAESAMGLWEQARAGLLATVVARQRNPASIHRLVSQQVMDGNSDRVVSMRVRADSSVDTISFVASRSAQDFVKSGFRRDSADRRTTFGPDAVVLLSDAFAAAYCFQLADGGRERPTQVGIRFRPAQPNAERLDIDGTLWIDTAARELRDVGYAYLGLPARTEAFHPGGRVSFRAMRNGVVLVDRWNIRSVGTAIDTIWTATGSGSYTPPNARGHGIGDPGGGSVATRSLRGRQVATLMGGELASASWPDGTAWHAPLGALRAQVLTRDGRPAAKALVTLVGTPFFGNTDSSGVVQIKGLLPGPYEARTVVDPRLAELGIGSGPTKRIVIARDSTAMVTLAAPTAESLSSERCASAGHLTAADSVFLLGQVVTAEGGPVVDAKLTFATVTDHVARWHGERASTASNGVFLSCRGWKVGDVVLARVNQTAAGDVDVTRTIDGKVLILRITLPPPR